MRRQWNDPAIGQAFSNLAQIFAPPSPQQYLAAEKMRGLRFQNEAQQQAWEALTREGVTPSLQDMYGIAGKAAFGNQGWDPSNSNRAVDIQSADRRYNTDVSAQSALDVQGLRDVQSSREAAFNARINPQGVQAISDADIAATLGLEVPGFGAKPPVAPSLTQVQGRNLQEQLGGIPGLAEALAADGVNASNVVTPNGTRMMPTGLAAVRGAEPAAAPSNQGMGDLKRFLIPGENGEMQVVSAFTLPTGAVVMPDGTDITALNPIPASNSGGTQFEIGPNGEVRISMGMDGLTNRTTSGLQGSRESSLQLKNSMTSLFRNLTPESLGVAGQFNDEFVNRVVAQFVPNAANLNVAAQRTQLRSAIVREARGILGNDRLNREDRERIAQLMPDPNTIFESHPRARAALATIATYAAYDAAFADARLQGGMLPPLNPQLIGQLVDQGALDIDVAQTAVSALFPGPRRDTARPAPQTAAPSAAVPQGGVQPPPEAVQMLQGNPSPQTRAQFDEVFGPGAAARALGE